MRNTLIKYLLFLCTLLIGISNQANGLFLSSSPTIPPIERNGIVDYQTNAAASNIHAPKSTIIFLPIEFSAADIEEEIEEVKSNKKYQSAQNCINSPAYSHFGSYSNHNYYDLTNQYLQEYKKYLLNCVYLL